MIAPTYRRPRSSLSPEDVANLVHMREQGATWKEIGRTFGKQDGACKSIFDRARVARSEAPAVQAQTCAPA